MVSGRMAKRPASPPATPDAEPMKTRTLPETQRGIWFDDPDVVTMLRVYGSDTEFDLPRTGKTFTLGSSPERDIAIPGGYLSSLHCVIERRGHGLRVHDQGSHNGTFFDGRRESVFDLRPGATFTAASIRFLALNDEMRAAYPTLADLLGGEDEHAFHSAAAGSPSDLIIAATGGTNLLITGEAGSDHDRLARTIHEISLLRTRPIVELDLDAVPTDRAQQRALLDRASRSTLVLTIGMKTPVLDATFASMMFSSAFHVRVIAIAPLVSKANDVLGEVNVRAMLNVALRPLVQRPGAILRLLDRMFAARETPLRVSELTAANRTALQGHGWPGNVAELRLAADRLVAIAREGSLLKASKALGVSNSTLHYWFTQAGLSLPLGGS